MFYSHEVLTNRKYGVATIWLVATLGSKSATSKKVTRKAILNVDVPKACEAILEPEVPLALRLQSNLLYGVSKVYSQQCSYVLSDAQNMQNHVRMAMVQVAADTALDPEAGRARPDQLVLQDDPTFLPDFALAPLDLEGIDLASPPRIRSNSLSSSPRSRSPRRTVALEELGSRSILGLQLPSSDSGGVSGYRGFVVPGDEGPGTEIPGGSALNFEDDGFEPGVDFGFDAEGNLIEHWAAENLNRTPSTVARPRLPSNSALSARVRQDHEEAQQLGRDYGQYGEQEDIEMPLEDEDEVDLLPEAKPFPSVHNQPSPAPENTQREEEIAESSSVVQAPVRHQLKKRVIQLDERMELRNTDLAGWMNNYLDNMREAGSHRFALRSAAQAKKNAEYWVLGMGIGGIGGIAGTTGLAGPLEMFCGDALLLSLGIDRNASKKKEKKRGAQEASEGDHSDEDGRRVRQRSDEDEVGRGDVDMEEDGRIVNIEEEEVEVPREAEPEQEERDLSQMFPWNVTASVRDSSLAPSARRALGFGGSGPSSFGGPAGSIGRRSRLVSESPLRGRGKHGNIRPLSSPEAGDFGDDTLGGMGGDVSVGGDEEFELYGPAAAVDTQTANESQFARAAFAKEMENFGMFIFDSLKRKEEDVAAEWNQVEGVNEILFEDALPPESTTSIVAAQGFMHLLSLATLGRVAARQDEPFAEIGMSLPLAGEVEDVQ